MLSLPLYNDNLLNLFYEFKDLLRAKGLVTADMRLGRIREFLFFLECKGLTDVKKIKATDILMYCEYLKERPNQRRGGGLSEITMKGHLATIGIFFEYLTDAGYRANSPMRVLRFSNKDYKERELLTVEEVKKVYDVCSNKRERAIVALAYGCGLRRAEIASLNISDIIFGKGMLTVREGKGNKSRVVPLSDSVIKDLREYLIYERDFYLEEGTHVSAFLLNDIGQRIMNNHLSTMFRRIFIRTGIRKQITLHCLRHSLATHLLDKGADIEFVKEILGHSSIDTTHIYSKKRKQKLKVIKQMQSYGNKK
jgi:integrase/recombinase XerD